MANPTIQGSSTPVSGVKQTINTGTTNVEYKKPLMVNSDNVQMQDDDAKFSLTDFYNNWKAFKQHNSFFYWGTNEPKANKLQIKMWYNPEF